MIKRKEGIVMKMNLKLRYMNKTTLATFVSGLVALVYQVLALCGVTPPISESEVVETAGVIINLFVLLGIVVDPTTKGIRDSDTAMTYTEPRPEIETAADEEE